MPHDIYNEVTNKIIEVLDQVNPDDYEPPFAGMAAQGLPLNPTTGKHYQGVNILALWFNQQASKFTANEWATFKQWQAKGANVRKGEKGSKVVFYKTLHIEEKNDQGELENSKIPMLKVYTVFNACQIEGYETQQLAPAIDLVSRLELVDRFCTATKADIRHGEARAYYHRIHDYINMPETAAFVDTKNSQATENYYSTLLHELTHWSGAPHRLDRDKAKTNKERDKYAFEELVAELGAAFLCAQLGVTQAPREDHALYIKSWLQALKDDKKYVFGAAAQAARAAEYLNSLQPQPTNQGGQLEQAL